MRVGAAIHSVRAVPREALPTVAAWARGRPLHVHLSEQPDENAACLAAHGRTPTALLDEAGALGPATTAVHATHLTDDDVARLARTGARACFCPTTERDLGDGIGPGRRAGDGPACRCAWAATATPSSTPSRRCARWRCTSGCATACGNGSRPASSWTPAPTARDIAVGAPADLVTVDTASVRTAGARPDGVLLAASAADVREVRVGGHVIVRDGVHQLVERPAARLAAEIGALHARAQEAA